MQDFKNLKVWERAHQLTLQVYQATRCFPSGRALWANVANAASKRIDWSQHC